MAIVPFHDIPSHILNLKGHSHTSGTGYHRCTLKKRNKAGSAANLRPPLDRDTFIQSLNSTTFQRLPSPAEFKSPATIRSRLQAKFYEVYHSQGKHFPGWEYMTKMGDDFSAMRITLDTAYLTVVGSQVQEPRLLIQARKSYSRALICFRNELSRQSSTRLVGVAQVLVMCEMFSAITSDPTGWRQHARGIKTIMENCCKEDIESGYLEALLKSHVRVPWALWHGLLERNGGTNVERLYSRKFAGSARIAGTVTDFHGLSKRVPAVLQRTDQCCREGVTADSLNIVSTLNDAMAMEELMHHWMADTVAKSKESHFVVVPLEQLKDSALASVGDSSVFPHVYSFINAEQAIIYISYWMCLINLRHAHLDVRAAVGDELYPFRFGRTHLARLECSISEVADALCMSTVYLALSENGYLGLMACMAPLQFAARWYEASRDNTKLDWCRAAAESLRSKGLCTSIMDLGVDVLPSPVDSRAVKSESPPMESS